MIDIDHLASARTGHARLGVTGSLDVIGACQLRRKLNSIADQGAHHIDVDLSRVAFIDSSGMGVLARRWALPTGRAEPVLTLVGATGQFWTVARLGKLTRVFDHSTAAAV